MTTLIDQFADLFWGNEVAVGTEDGGCWRFGENPGSLMLSIEQHLTGEDEPCGVYPMVREIISVAGQGHLPGGWFVHWGCVDFDEGEEESWVHAYNVRLALSAYEVCGWIERSRSKGYHVWVFADSWVPAQVMRDALLAACQCVDAPTKEVNPKQYTLKDGQLGNYVRLPYPGWLMLEPPHNWSSVRLSRRVMLHPDKSIVLLSEFVRKALEARTPIGTLETLAAAYTPPEAPIRRRDWEQRTFDDELHDRLRGIAKLIYAKGPLDGSGRGHTLYKLACHLRENGMHTRDEAFVLVAEADENWGKFHERPDCEKRLAELVDRAWSSTE